VVGRLSAALAARVASSRAGCQRLTGQVQGLDEVIALQADAGEPLRLLWSVADVLRLQLLWL
jgi:hypothetical protein